MWDPPTHSEGKGKAKAKQRQSKGKAKAKQSQSKGKAKANHRQSKGKAKAKTRTKSQNRHLGPSWARSWPSWDHLGTSLSHLGRFWSFAGSILEQSLPILAQLAPSWGYLGTFLVSLGPTWPRNGHLEPSWRHLGTKTFFRTPRPDLIVPQPHRLSLFWGPCWGSESAYFYSNFGGLFLCKFWGILGNTFGAILGTHFGPDRPKEAKMGPRGPSRASKYRKPALANTLKNQRRSMFLGSKAFQDSLGRPKKAPKRHPKSSNTSKKVI